MQDTSCTTSTTPNLSVYPSTAEIMINPRVSSSSPLTTVPSPHSVIPTGVPKTKAHHPTLWFNQNLILSTLTQFWDTSSGLVAPFTGPPNAKESRYAVQPKPKSMLQMNVQNNLIISIILSDLNLIKEIMPGPTKVYTDNAACVCWAQTMTTKGLRHIQIRENTVHKAVQRGGYQSRTHIRLIEFRRPIYKRKQRHKSLFPNQRYHDG